MSGNADYTELDMMAEILSFLLDLKEHEWSVVANDVKI
jgi:hypothetical protein